MIKQFDPHILPTSPRLLNKRYKAKAETSYSITDIQELFIQYQQQYKYIDQDNFLRAIVAYHLQELIKPGNLSIQEFAPPMVYFDQADNNVHIQLNLDYVEIIPIKMPELSKYASDDSINYTLKQYEKDCKAALSICKITP